MTLPSSHIIRNSSSGDLRQARYLSITEAPHDKETSTTGGENPEYQTHWGQTIIVISCVTDVWH